MARNPPVVAAEQNAHTPLLTAPGPNRNRAVKNASAIARTSSPSPIAPGGGRAGGSPKWLDRQTNDQTPQHARPRAQRALGKTGNCQIVVSVHAVGAKGTVPLGWALYLPEEWCEDAERRKKAKIPEEIEFQTKPELAVELVARAAGWDIAKAPLLGRRLRVWEEHRAARAAERCCA